MSDRLPTGVESTERALDLFDSLEPATIAFMTGTWLGAEFPSCHPLDGMLAAAGFYGKRFVDAETAHPLLFYTASRREAFAIDPGRIPLPVTRLEQLPLRDHPGLHWLVLAARPAVQTRSPKARLRMVECRGQVSATMIYDDLPINDVFRRVDDDTVLGMMDMRGLARPFFFVLRRDASVPVIVE